MHILCHRNIDQSIWKFRIGKQCRVEPIPRGTVCLWVEDCNHWATEAQGVRNCTQKQTLKLIENNNWNQTETVEKRFKIVYEIYENVVTQHLSRFQTVFVRLLCLIFVHSASRLLFRFSRERGETRVMSYSLLSTTFLNIAKHGEILRKFHFTGANVEPENNRK